MKDAKRRKITKLTKRALALLVSASMLLTSLYVSELDGIFEDFSIPYIVHAANFTTEPYEISSLEDLYDFSYNYATDDSFATRYQTAEIRIDFNEMWVLENNHSFSETVSKDFYPIGSNNIPFMGRIKIMQVDSSIVAIRSTMPLFDGVYDSVDIINQDNSDQTLSIIRSETMSGSVPLFANTVYNDSRDGSSPATWNIMASPYVDESNNYAHDFSGIIGTVGDSSNVNIVLDFAACAELHDANIISDDSVGLACGVMGQDSTVNFTLKGSTLYTPRTGYSVSTIGDEKSAGSIVGEMASDSTLNVYLEPDTEDPTIYYDLATAKIIDASGVDSYAGGLVGKNVGGNVNIYKNEYGEGNALTQTRQVYISQDTVSAVEAAGGIFGYYLATADDTFNDNYEVYNCTVSAKNAGGFVGIFDGANYDVSFMGTDSTTHLGVNVVVSDTCTVDNFGGLIGKYLSSDLSKTLDIEHVSVTMSKSGSPAGSAYGGLIGFVDGSDSGHAAVYIKADDIIVTANSGYSSATYFGGLFGKTGTNGSLLDVGSFKLTSSGAYEGGGVVGYMDRGVLRLSGTTDLTEASTTGSNSHGQIVGKRGASLVYATGTGSEESASYEDGGWRFERYTNDQRADDIGTWGEVVRLNAVSGDSLINIEDSTENSITKVLTFDTSAHTVTVDGPVYAMASTQDIVKTALNMQLNNGDVGALRFADPDNTSSVLLSSQSLTVDGEISLSGTGITSLTRDDGVNNDFSGNISGVTDSSTDKIILATGEKYGIYTEGKTGTGEIYAHKYNGLFAEIGGGSIEKLTIDGEIDCDINVGSVYIGGVAADITDGLTVTDCIVNLDIDYKGINGSDHYVGGLAGQINSSNSANVSVTGSTLSPNIVASGSLGETLKVAGGIAYVDSTSSFSIEIENSSLAFKVDGSSATSTATNLHMAGLIADINYKGAGASDDTRKVVLSGNTFADCEVKNNATITTGGMIGHSWLNTDTELTNNTFSSNNVLWTDATAFSALCYKATGYWQVNTKGLKVDSLAIKDKSGNAIASNHVTGFGFIVDYGYNEVSEAVSSLYLENTAADSYSLDTSGVIVPSMTSGVYDEFVAYSGKSILENGNGVISICLSNALKMNGTDCNTYQNKYNTTLTNANSRYYYNFAANKTSTTAGWKLLRWSLNKYASKNIQRCFTNPFTDNKITNATYDMNGISYYPIDIPSGVTVTLGTVNKTAEFKFYNENIEKAENVTIEKGNTDELIRSTVDDSQHYLMHSGLFRNVNGTINAVGAVTFTGSIGSDDTYSGVLINHSLNGSVTTTLNQNITFNNLSLRGASGNKNTDGYLFIHSINSDSSLTLRSVRLSGYPNDGSTVASSLIGDVAGTDINLKFEDIQIDGRNATGAANSNLDGLTTVYSTSRSIFENATLLNKFDVNTNSVAIYNFELTKDWTDSSHTPGNVTYGRELTDSQEYPNLENKYYAASDDGRKYVNPKDEPTTSIYAAGFSSDFLPYVRYFTKNSLSGYTVPSVNADIAYREIKVNVLSTDLTDGCGTYDHPYEITNPQQLIDIAEMINGGTNLGSICLPKTVSLHSNSSYNHWCLDNEGNHSCTDTYTCPANGHTYTSTADGATDWSDTQVREYLCGAYYQIEGEIPLNTFVGLGSTSGEGKYAFRGVIIGTSGAIIKNNTTAPLIKVSNGSVVKDLEIEVNTDGTVASCSSVNTPFSYANGNIYYGGVIGEIMGGDNIIDNVKVNYIQTNDQFLHIDTSGSAYLCTVGGYVGVIVNGGLVFRNMSTNPLNGKTNAELQAGNFKVGNKSAGSSFSRPTDYKHLYINPFVGRVINGYAINETDSYSGDTGTYTLDNGDKNYRIADVNKNPGDNIITFDDFVGTNDKLCIPDGQSLFMLSLITQSGAGSAPSATGDYAYGVAYDGTERYDENSAAQYAATHLASYDYVGNVMSGDSVNPAANTDWEESCRDRVNSTTCVPYIISKYTSGSGESYLARTVTNLTYMIELTTTGGDYKLPECFRGIGSICRLKSDDFLPDGKKINNTYPAYTAEEMKDEDGKFVMKIYGLKGNNSKIWINLNYKTYYNENDNYIYTVYKSTESGSGNNGMVNTRNHIGFGLFNYVKQIPQSGKDNTTYNTTSGYYIGDFTLTGQVVVKEYSSEGTEQTQTDGYSQDATGKNFRRHRHSVGGVIGVLCIDDYVNLVNADMVDITISGAYMVGGYIGRVDITERNMGDGHNMNYIFVNGCDTEKTIITCGGGHCGGIVAGSHSGYMCVYVNTARNANTSDVKNRSTDGYYKSSMELSITNKSRDSGAGTSGVVGGCRNGYNTNIWINNTSITGYSKSGECEAAIINYNTNYRNSGEKNGVGGFIGYVRKAESIIVTNSSVYNITINGQNAGGLFGYIDYFTNVPNFGTSPKIKIYNCNIYADNKTSGYSITSNKNAGGITGGFITEKDYNTSVTGYDGNSYKYDIDGVDVYNYTISAAESCGGLIGYANNGIRSIVNSSVHDCTLKGADNKSLGGIVGSTNKEIYGYNISSYDNVFAGRSGATTTATKGNFIGATNNKTIKIVAFSRKDNTYNGSGLSNDIGSGSNNNNYIICSDYRGVCETVTSANKTPSNLTNLPIVNTLDDVGSGAREDYFPYANVNPRTDMGEEGASQAFFTSDGIALYSVPRTDPDTGAPVIDEQTGEQILDYFPVANAVVGDKNAESGVSLFNSSLYNKAYTGAYSGQDSTTNGAYVKTMLDAGDDADVRMSTYGHEMGLPNGYDGKDFPVIALGGAATNYEYTAYIESYIRLMTNTTDSYTAASVNNKYNIKIWPCRYDSVSGQYRVITDETDTNKSLYISNSKYYMRENKADSLNKDVGQFTLIDVQFLNPMNNKEVAYHLFVPVLTQKMAKFEFHSDVEQGANYVASKYNEIGRNNVYAGTFDNWITAYVQFKYSAADITTILSTGKGLTWSSDKVVTFNYASDKDLADGTQFVLLDANNNRDKAYYLNKSSGMTASSTGSYPKDNLVFTDFMESDGTTPFEGLSFYDLAGNTIQYTQNASGKYYEVQPGTSGIIACAYDSDGDNVKYFKEWTSGSVTRYDLTATADIVESYYISMYAYSNDNVLNNTLKTDSAYPFTVTCPTTLSGLVTSKKKSETNTSVYLGNMFEQTLSFSNQTGNLVISKDNHELEITMTSVVKFVDSKNKTYFQNKLHSENLPLYQGFLLDMNKKEEILGKKTGNSRISQIDEYTWTISTSSDPDQTNTVREVSRNDVPYVYVEPVCLTIPSSTEAPDWSSTQTATVRIKFTDDEDDLANMFMSKTFDGSFGGNDFHASANLDFSEDGVEHSNMRISDEAKNHRYYMRRQQKLELMLTADDQVFPDEYDKTGEQSQNFSALGINAKYVNTGKKYPVDGNTEHIEAIANIDLSSLPNTYLDGTHSLKLTFSLNQKRNKNLSEYSYNDVLIDTYLQNFKLCSKDANTDGIQDEITSNAVKSYVGGDYIYTFPLTGDSSSWLINYDDEEKLFDARVTFDVITADDFEEITEYLYSNYQLNMTAAIVDTETGNSVLSSDDDWIVYTHAKVNAQFVVPATTPSPDPGE